MSEHVWQVIAELNGVLDAQALVGRLEAEGIPAQMEEIGPNTALPVAVGWLGMVRVYVPEEMAAQALSIADHDYSEELEEMLVEEGMFTEEELAEDDGEEWS
jgi:hypothetical protein